MYTLYPQDPYILRPCCTIGNEKGVHMYTLYLPKTPTLRACCTIGNEKGVHMYTLYLPKTPTLRACCTIGNEKVNPNGISTSFETLQKNIPYIFFFNFIPSLFFCVLPLYKLSISLFFLFIYSLSLSLFSSLIFTLSCCKSPGCIPPETGRVQILDPGVMTQPR